MHVQLYTNTMQQVQQYEIQAINYDGMTPKNADGSYLNLFYTWNKITAALKNTKKSFGDFFTSVVNYSPCINKVYSPFKSLISSSEDYNCENLLVYFNKFNTTLWPCATLSLASCQFLCTQLKILSLFSNSSILQMYLQERLQVPKWIATVVELL
jgi:hypothetical protein